MLRVNTGHVLDNDLSTLGALTPVIYISAVRGGPGYPPHFTDEELRLRQMKSLSRVACVVSGGAGNQARQPAPESCKGGGAPVLLSRSFAFQRARERNLLLGLGPVFTLLEFLFFELGQRWSAQK